MQSRYPGNHLSHSHAMPCKRAKTMEMFNEIRTIDNDFDDRSRQSPGEAFYWILGKKNPDIEAETMTQILVTAGTHISAMYKAILRQNMGIG